MICAPPPASARGGWDDDGDGRRRHDAATAAITIATTNTATGARRATTHGYSYGYRPAPGYGWYAPRHVEHARYRCEPCGHWYDDEASFHRHIHRHHHIAQAVIPMVIGAAAFGWIFYGH